MIRPKAHVSSAILLAHCCEMPAKKELRKSVRARQQQQPTTTRRACHATRVVARDQNKLVSQCNAMQYNTRHGE